MHRDSMPEAVTIFKDVMHESAREKEAPSLWNQKEITIRAHFNSLEICRYWKKLKFKDQRRMNNKYLQINSKQYKLSLASQWPQLGCHFFILNEICITYINYTMQLTLHESSTKNMIQPFQVTFPKHYCFSPMKNLKF